MAKKKASLGKRIIAVRDSLGENQKTFAATIGANQGTLSVWERDVASPPAMVLFRIGSLCKDPSEALWFFKKAGLSPEALASAAVAADVKVADRRTVAVPSIAGKGEPWYMDSRLIPNPKSTVYWDSDQHAGVYNRPSASFFGIKPYHREVIVLDTSVKELGALLHKVVLIESGGPSSGSPGLPDRGFHMGRIWIDLGLTREAMEQGRAPVCSLLLMDSAHDPWDFPVRGFRLVRYAPQLTDAEKQAIGWSAHRLQAEQELRFEEARQRWTNELLKRWERENISIAGRVLCWFRPTEEGEA